MKVCYLKQIILKKLWVDQGSEFYNKTFDKLLKKYSIEIYHTFNKGKVVITERFNRTLKCIIIHNYINALEGMIQKYNNTVHSAIQMKPKDVVHKKTLLKYLMLFMKITILYIHSITLILVIK